LGVASGVGIAQVVADASDGKKTKKTNVSSASTSDFRNILAIVSQIRTPYESIVPMMALMGIFHLDRWG
jgi:hypothetical protein